MPRRASLSGYCAVVRTPLRSPTTDVAVPPTFEPRQPPLVSWHFSLLVPQASVPISADHCLLQKAPECNALPAPSSFWGLLEKRSEEHTSELQSHSDIVCRL